MSVYVIAEAGTSHDLQIEKARRLIAAAALAGASAVKFQWWSDSKHLAARRNAPELAEMYEGCRIPEDWLPTLEAVATAAGLEFMTTAYLPEDIVVVAPFVSRFKIASFESQDRAFVLAHKPFGKPTVISTGLCDLPALWKLRSIQAEASRSGWDVRLLQCVSAYPCAISDLNLATISQYDLDGFSDHTESLLTGAFAVTAGARIVEKHLRLGDTDPANPDFGHSLPPGDFADYVENVRLAEAAMGDGRKTVAEAEAPWARYVVRP